MFSGRKCELMILSPPVAEIITMAVQMGAPNLRVIIKWEVKVTV